MEPRGTLYVRVRHTEPADLFRRRGLGPSAASRGGVFGAELEAVVAREVRAQHAAPVPRAARATLVFLLDHLALVVAAQDRNKMSAQHLAVAMAPPLMLHTQQQPPIDLDYQRPIHVLQCLLQIWPPP